MKMKKWIVGLAAGASLTAGGIATVALAPSASATQYVSSVPTSKTFVAGDRLTSPNGQFYFTMQSDGNAVEYNSWNQALWSTGTAGHPGARFVAQSDGNLVVYSPSNQVLWQSHTNGKPATQFVLGVDGNLVLRNANTGAVIWANYAYQSVILPGQKLATGYELTGGYGSQVTLNMQTDGNLVIRHGGTVLFQSKTSGNSGAWATLQSDGNFVVYSASKRALWSSGTAGKAPRKLTLGSNGDLVLTGTSGAATWQSTPPVSTAQAKINKAISYALSKVGDRYVNGKRGPSTFDCAGLTWAAYSSAGIDVGGSPNVVSTQYKTAQKKNQIFSYADRKPGDLIFWKNSKTGDFAHVGIYLGTYNGKTNMMVAAASVKEGVRLQTVWDKADGEYRLATVARPTAGL